MAHEQRLRRDTKANITLNPPVEGEPGLETDTGRLVLGSAAGVRRFAHAADIQNSAVIYAAGSGSNTITLTLDPAPTAWTAGMVVAWKQQTTNTGAATINPNSIGAKTLKKNGGADDLAAGDLVGGGVYVGWYDGTYVQLSGVASGGGMTLLSTATLSGSAQSDFTTSAWFGSTYRRLLWVIENLRIATNDQLALRVSFDGITFQTTNNYTSSGIFNDPSAPSYATELAAYNHLMLTYYNTLGSGAASFGINGIVEVFNWTDTNAPKIFAWRLGYKETVTYGRSAQATGGFFNSASALLGVRFKSYNGYNLTGVIKLFGVK